MSTKKKCKDSREKQLNSVLSKKSSKKSKAKTVLWRVVIQLNAHELRARILSERGTADKSTRFDWLTILCSLCIFFFLIRRRWAARSIQSAIVGIFWKRRRDASSSLRLKENGCRLQRQSKLMTIKLWLFFLSFSFARARSHPLTLQLVLKPTADVFSCREHDERSSISIRRTEKTRQMHIFCFQFDALSHLRF